MFKIQTRQRAQYYSRVIELYLTGELSVRRIAKILPVGRATISRWIDNFAAENPETVQRVMSKRFKFRKFNMQLLIYKCRKYVSYLPPC